jgi:hypothetical protein
MIRDNKINLLDNLKKSDVEVFGEIEQVINIVESTGRI